VTAPRLYWIGLAAVALLGIMVVALSPEKSREEIAVGLGAGLLIQAPLGWWTLRSIGTGKFQAVWVGGMLIRLLIVAIAAVVLAPAYRWDAGALLRALVATLLVLLLIEAMTAVRKHTWDKQ